jgi:hypothetical protein
VSGSPAARGNTIFLFLHGVSLDAVVVLLAYQWALGRWAGADLPTVAYLFLAMGIWLGYMVDRLLDLKGSPELARSSPRHAFLARHRSRLHAAWVAVAMTTGAAGPLLLPLPHLAAGAVFSVLAAVYVASASGALHGERGRRVGPGARRLATVGLLTLSGAWWFAGDPGAFDPGAGWVMGLFAVAAWLNLGRLRLAGTGVRPPSRERVALAVDSAVLAVMLVVGTLAP